MNPKKTFEEFVAAVSYALVTNTLSDGISLRSSNILDIASPPVPKETINTCFIVATKTIKTPPERGGNDPRLQCLYCGTRSRYCCANYSTPDNIISICGPSMNNHQICISRHLSNNKKKLINKLSLLYCFIAVLKIIKNRPFWAF